MSVIIPKGYRPIAVRDERMGACVLSYNEENKTFIIVLGEKIAGPYVLDELKLLAANMKDVIEMRGQYLFITEYGPDGRKDNDIL